MMPGFALSDSCVSNPPAPPGYAIWRGPVPPELTQAAIALRDHIASFPYGQQWATSWNGSAVVFRKDSHRWTYRGGVLVTGICIPGITLYRAIPTGVSGLGAVYATDPATTQPDPQLALYGAKSTWKPALAITAVGALTAGALLWHRK